MSRTLVIAKPDAVERGLVGEIVARLADWRPGTLVADIPVDMTAGPR